MVSLPDHRLANAIRRLATQSNEAGKPVTRVFGIVTNIKPFTVQINDRLILDEDFLAITQTVRNYINWKFIEVGDKVVMTRQTGGQIFIVDDMLSCDKDFDRMVIMSHTHEYLDTQCESSSDRITKTAERVEHNVT